MSEEEIKTYLKSQNNEQNMTSNMIRQCQGSIGRLVKIGEEQEAYTQVENVINNIKKEDITQIWKKAEVLYQAKEKITDLLDYMNVVFFEKLREEQDMRYAKAVSIVEEAKKRITANANYDMSIDNLLLRIWEQFA